MTETDWQRRVRGGYKLNLKFDINFPNCNHTSSSTASSKSNAGSTAKRLIEKQNGLCGKCYSDYCDKNNIVPWYIK